MRSKELLVEGERMLSTTSSISPPDIINTGIVIIENKTLKLKDRLQTLDPNLLAMEGFFAGILIYTLPVKPKLAAICGQLLFAVSLASSEAIGQNSNGYENAMLALVTPIATIGTINFIQSLLAHE